MTTLKAQLTPMLKASSKVLIVLLILLTGCSTNHKYTRSDYHKDLMTNLNLKDEKELVEFKIIDSDYEEKELDLRYLLYTLTNYINAPSKFNYESEKYIEYAFEVGLISRFENKYIDQKYAQQMFDLANQIKEKKISNFDNSVYKEGYSEESEIDEIYESIDLEYNNELDFNDAEIIEYFNYVEEEKLEDQDFRMLGETLASKSYNLGDYKITYTVTDSNIKVKVTNEKLNGNFYLQSEINNIKLHTKLKANSDEDYTYFKIDFNTEESVGFKKGIYKDRYADIKNFDKNNVLNSLSKMFKPKSEIAETTVDLFEINLPIDKFGTAKVTLQVKLHFYASGKVELTFNTQNSLGFERVNGNIRYINDMDKKMDFIARASSDATTSLTAGLKIGKTRIADIRFEAGVKGYVTNKVHIFDDDSYKTLNTNLPGDYVDEMLSVNSDFKVCSDMSLFWLLKITINSSGSLLNKMGASHTYDVFGEREQLIKGPIHLENFLVVEKCTVKNKNKKEEVKENTVKEQLQLNKYFKSLKVNDTYSIEFKNIPKGYSKDDLNYASSNSNISVSNNGTIKALNYGSAVITITTKDNKYQTSISIMVKQ